MQGKIDQKLPFNMSVGDELVSSVWTDQEMADEIRSKAQEEHRSIQRQIRFYLQKGIEHVREQSRNIQTQTFASVSTSSPTDIVAEARKIIANEMEQIFKSHLRRQREFMSKGPRVQGVREPSSGPKREESAA